MVNPHKFAPKPTFSHFRRYDAPGQARCGDFFNGDKDLALELLENIFTLEKFFDKNQYINNHFKSDL